MHFRSKISKIFRGRTIFRSKSREIAPKFVPLGGAQLAHDPQRSPTTVPSVSMLRRVRFFCDSKRISDRKFRNFFAAAKFRVRNCARLRRKSRCPTTPSLAARQEGPQTLCRASARCGARDFVRFATDFGPKFSKIFARPQNFAFGIARDRAKIRAA